MAHQTLDTPQTFCQLEKFGGAYESPGGGQAIIFQAKRYDAPKTPGLLSGNLVIWMIPQAGVEDPVNRRMTSQEFCYLTGAGSMLAHTQGQGFHAPDHEPGVERTKDSSGSILVKADLLTQFFRCSNYQPCDQVTMSAQIFCC